MVTRQLFRSSTTMTIAFALLLGDTDSWVILQENRDTFDDICTNENAELLYTVERTKEEEGEDKSVARVTISDRVTDTVLYKRETIVSTEALLIDAQARLIAAFQMLIMDTPYHHVGLTQVDMGLEFITATNVVVPFQTGLVHFLGDVAYRLTGYFPDTHVNLRLTGDSFERLSIPSRALAIRPVALNSRRPNHI